MNPGAILSRIWAQNRRYLLLTGAGLALFLILNSCISSYAERVEGPTGLYARSTKLAREIRQLHKEVAVYNEVRSVLTGYEEQEAELRGAVELSPEKELESFDESTPILQFEKAVDRVWEQAVERANRVGVILPEKPDSRDFGVARGDARREYESHYANLGVLRRGLEVLIRSGMVEIGRPEFLEADYLPVLPDDESLFVLFRALRFRVVGPYDSYIRALQAVQSPGDFLQVRIRKMTVARGNEEGLIAGDLDFVAFRLVDAADLESERTRGTGRRGRRR
jgi:hypothetical protein